jgi:hypothetical protein
MRFLSAAILSISLLVPGAIGAEAAKKKPSRARSFFHSVGAFAAGTVLVDPYQEVRSTRNRSSSHNVMPAAEQSSPATETQAPPAEKSEKPREKK